jgi:hypothetical protein
MLYRASDLAGVYEHGNELEGSTTGDEFLYQLRHYQLLRKDSEPLNI